MDITATTHLNEKPYVWTVTPFFIGASVSETDVELILRSSYNLTAMLLLNSAPMWRLIVMLAASLVSSFVLSIKII